METTRQGRWRVGGSPSGKSKLDCFSVGRLAFVELACGMSALALGTMDEKLQVCFDLFDSEGDEEG
ncbi:unnamed protein product [Effrenium voratum]|nr:unnamed protein product [Effrenium voratum]